MCCKPGDEVILSTVNKARLLPVPTAQLFWSGPKRGISRATPQSSGTRSEATDGLEDN